MMELVSAAQGLPVTFHRAFDRARDCVAALEDVISLGATRILTSGTAKTALEGVEVIAKVVSRSEGRITIVAGGGVRANNVRAVIGRTGVTEVHSRMLDEAQMRSLVELAGYQ
jgi:copper homeostasis protein